MLVVSSYDAQWFAVQVKARAERNVASLLQAKGYEEFLPVTTARRAGRKCEIPLLPGYVFCRMNPNVQGLIVTTPGVIKIISFGGKPAPIDPEEIHSCDANFPTYQIWKWAIQHQKRMPTDARQMEIMVWQFWTYGPRNK